MFSYIYTGVRECHVSETLRKVVMLNIFLVFGFLLLLIMGGIALVQNAWLLGGADFFLATLFASLQYYLHKSGNEPIASRLGVGITLLFFCYLFVIGGVHTTAFMWLYTFPLFSLYLLGLRHGIWSTSFLFCFCVAFLAFDVSSDSIDVYSKDFAMRFIPSFLSVCILAFLVENCRADTHDAMLEKQRLLTGIVSELREKEIELEEARNQLELRVALRTEELETANRQLRVEIEERKLAQQERLRLESALLRAEKMELLGRLAGGVAHDLNNVLSGIVSYPDLLLLTLSPESEMRGPLQNIRRAGKRAAVIVQDLLALARRGITLKENIQLNDIVLAHLQSPEFITLQKNYPGVRVETHLASNLRRISGSPVHLEKAVMNLLINSFEAIEKEGTIVVASENRNVDTAGQEHDSAIPGEYVVLIIRDSGMGILPENLEKIFDPFYSSKIMGRSGTGLGMTVVWSTIKDHNGYLDVQSSPGKGTTITMYFPAHEDENITRIESRSEVIERGNGETILLVDDDADQRILGTSILTTLGYKVETVASGEEAIDFLKGRNADLVLLDMIMEGGKDGLDTYQSILEIRPNQKVIIVSGYSESEKVTKIRELGVHTYLKKPYSLERIASAIHEALGV